MQRFSPYLGTAVLALLAALLVGFSGPVSVLHLPAPVAPSASSTLPVTSSGTLPSIELPSVEPQKSPTTSAPAKQNPPEKKPTQPASAKITATVSATTSPPVPEPSSVGTSTQLESEAIELRKALVNIICYAPINGGLRSVSGSGVLVDPKGVILTNAHVAQYFLLADRGVSCTIRSGSPAVDVYKASIAYISPAWLSANADVITKKEPTGTGQYDFALLSVTGSATSSAQLPYPFPYVPLVGEPPQIGTPVAIASYGAQFLAFDQIQSALFPIVVFDSIRDIFTFAVDTVDIFSLGGSAAAQEGSSGGGVIDGQGRLLGILTTSAVSTDPTKHVLNAITASYIRSEYANETGRSLNFLLIQPPTSSAASFAPRIPGLESIITAHL